MKYFGRYFHWQCPSFSTLQSTASPNGLKRTFHAFYLFEASFFFKKKGNQVLNLQFKMAFKMKTYVPPEPSNPGEKGPQHLNPVGPKFLWNLSIDWISWRRILCNTHMIRPRNWKEACRTMVIKLCNVVNEGYLAHRTAFEKSVSNYTHGLKYNIIKLTMDNCGLWKRFSHWLHDEPKKSSNRKSRELHCCLKLFYWCVVCILQAAFKFL